MQIQFELPKQRFLAGESMNATVTLVNDGAGALEVPMPEANLNWQPTYTLRGPGHEEGFTFSFRSVVFQDPSPHPQRVEPMTVALPPGGAHVAQVPLDRLVRLVKPGTYTLTVNLEWEGRSTQSSPVSFVIDRPGIRSCQFLATPGLQEPGKLPVFCIQGEASGTTEVYVAMFRQDRRTGLLVRSGLNHFATAESSAETVFGPWMNYSGLGTPPPRAGWQAGATLGVVGFRGDDGVRLTLPWIPRLVRPALMPQSAEVDLFVLNDQRSELSLVRFPKPGDETASSLLWTTALPGPVMGGRAALSPRKGGDRRHALLVTETDDGATLLLVDAGTGAAPPTLRSVKLEGQHALTDSEPALRIDEQGVTHGAVLLSSMRREVAGPRSLSVVDVVWPADPDAPASVDTTMVATLDDAPRASATTYSVAPGMPRREWLILSGDGRTLESSVAPGQPLDLSGNPMMPLDLLALKDFTYLLTLSDAGTLEFLRL